MKMNDLPEGVVRLSGRAEPLYVPAPLEPASSKSSILKRVLTIGAFAAAVSILPGNVGDLSAVAAISNGPLWAASLRAADEHHVASAQFVSGARAVSVRPQFNDVPANKDDSRLPAGKGPQQVAVIHSPETATSRLERLPTPLKESPASTRVAPGTSQRGDGVVATGRLPDPSDGRTTPSTRANSALEHWWSDRPLPEDIAAEGALDCLTDAIYFEARGESDAGQRAVAQVIINRVKNPAYPDDICGVVYQNREQVMRCQFTFACDRFDDVVTEKDRWADVQAIAKAYVSGAAWMDEIGAATHYHARSARPSWAKLMHKVKEIDGHVFYITKGGGWT
ncbi:MAG: cell wall hydrolase [Pseudomonadota bacterium]